jgi:hypothetical protein
MGSRFFFVTCFVVILALLAGCSVPPSTVAPIDSSSDGRGTPVELVEAQADNDLLMSATVEPATSQVSQVQDGPSLVESRCTQCHIAQGLQQIKKSRLEWEKSLAHMESIGVHLSDSEKDVLLDCLSISDKENY